MTRPECKRRQDDSGDWICDRCKSLWTEMLNQTGWLPLECADRPSLPPHDGKSGRVRVWDEERGAYFLQDATPPAPGADRAEWQPIETAPKDAGVIVWDGSVMGEAYYDGEDDSWWWANTGRGDYVANPVYPMLWQPMPAPPFPRAELGTGGWK